MEVQVVKQLFIQYVNIKKRQVVIAVLLFALLGQFAWAGVAEDISSGKSLQQVVQENLETEIQLKDLIAALDAAGVSGSDIICVLFQAGQDHVVVITAALDGGLSSSDIAGWADGCGATLSEIQTGYSMAGVNLPAHMVFSTAERYEGNAKDYLYNPPSPSK